MWLNFFKKTSYCNMLTCFYCTLKYGCGLNKYYQIDSPDAGCVFLACVLLAPGVLLDVPSPAAVFKHRVHPCCSLHSCIWSFLSSYHIVALYKYIVSDHVTCSRYITITATRLNNTRLLITISSIHVIMKVIIANNNNNNKNSNSSTSCVGYLQSSEGGESGVLSPAGAGLCKKCLSASGQLKNKNKNKTKQKTHIHFSTFLGRNCTEG